MFVDPASSIQLKPVLPLGERLGGDQAAVVPLRVKQSSIPPHKRHAPSPELPKHEPGHGVRRAH